MHTVEGNNTSIVGGIFGSASQVAKAPTKPLLSVTKETVNVPDAPTEPNAPTASVKKVNVTVPEAPEAPKPVEVEVQYYKLSTTPEKPVEPKPQTPKPQEPKNVLPQTGETASVALMLGGLSVGLLGLGLAKRKEQQ